jgi:hypothetical protein
MEFIVEVGADVWTPKDILIPDAGMIGWIERHPPRRSNSLVKGFLGILSAQMAQAGVYMADTGGTARLLSQGQQCFALNAGAAGTTYGIVVGTGTNAVALSDNKLQTQLTTNLYHGSGKVGYEWVSSSSCRIIASRTFANQSASDMNITEIGLYAFGNSSNHIFCIDRTLYSITVPDFAGITISYFFTISV